MLLSKKKILFVALILLIATVNYAQQQKSDDSLLKISRQNSKDTNVVIALVSSQPSGEQW